MAQAQQQEKSVDQAKQPLFIQLATTPPAKKP